MKSKEISTNPFFLIIIAVFCNILWGSAFPFIKIGYTEFEITTAVSQKLLFAGIRFFLAGMILLITHAIMNQKWPRLKKENRKTVVELGLVQTTLQYFFFYIGVSNTTAANGSIVNSMNVFLSAIVAHFIYKNDKLNGRKGFGCLIGFAGVMFVTLGGGSIHFAVNGEGFIVIADLMFAFGSVITKKATQKDDSMIVTAVNLAFGGGILAIAGLLRGGILMHVTVTGCIVLLYLSLLSAISFTLWAMLLKYNPIGKICIFNFVIPVSGTLLSGFILHENVLKIRYLISLILVSAGIFIVNMEKRKISDFVEESDLKKCRQ